MPLILRATQQPSAAGALPVSAPLGVEPSRVQREGLPRSPRRPSLVGGSPASLVAYGGASSHRVEPYQRLGVGPELLLLGLLCHSLVLPRFGQGGRPLPMDPLIGSCPPGPAAPLQLLCSSLQVLHPLRQSRSPYCFWRLQYKK
ncbi:hypothetical protein NDU88_005244 [Pleurodeles waltl]|uniref:Uncharacterized protein n=1 Tax=Pleurodeles waltl TaxID=8319 RepID=A0AAV7LP07_PLEWA|nr:hypothetical protein NDU88_005244 [Pleurodeles waltl]